MRDPLKSKRIQPGERVTVGNWDGIRTIVERVVPNPVTGDVEIFLDWGEHGKSRVWEHDENKTWVRFVYTN